jgi:hypothetical protein
MCWSSKYSFENIKAMAKDRGGKCLSEKYEGAHNKLEWQCKNGHIWKTTPNSIRRGSWCPQCTKNAWIDSKRMSISEMQEVAKTKGGKCLSTNYINNQTKLEWKCSKGHRWFATAANIKNHGKWCPKCSGNARLSIEDMRQIAKDRGGKCLSEKYINSVTKIKWRCSEGHEWSSVPSSVRSGTWCRKCSRKKLKFKRQNDLAK